MDEYKKFIADSGGDKVFQDRLRALYHTSKKAGSDFGVIVPLPASELKFLLDFQQVQLGDVDDSQRIAKEAISALVLLDRALNGDGAEHSVADEVAEAIAVPEFWQAMLDDMESSVRKIEKLRKQQAAARKQTGVKVQEGPVRMEKQFVGPDAHGVMRLEKVMICCQCDAAMGKSPLGSFWQCPRCTLVSGLM